MLLRRLLFLFLLLPIISVNAQSIFVNEYTNASAKENEWVELVTTEVVDIRGFKLRDFSGSGSPQSPLIFSQNDLWASLPGGTIIIVRGPSLAITEDFDPSDGVVIISVANATYITGSQFNIANGSDAIELLNASDVHIHGISHGDGNAASLPAPKNHYSGSSSSGLSIGYYQTKSLSDLTVNGKLTTFSSPTLGTGNDTDNADLIISFKELNEAPTVKMDVAGQVYINGSEVNFGASFLNEPVTITLNITNLGKQELNLSNLSVTGANFANTSPFSSSDLASKETGFLTIDFTPTSAGDKTGMISFTSNDPTNQTVTLQFKGLGLQKGLLMPISEARNLPLGTIVSVGGRVTVSNEFDGPSYFQDATGGLSIYLPDFHTQTAIGDSVQITGPLSEFGTTGNGKGLLQISGSNTSFSIIDVAKKEPTPLVLKINDFSEIHQSQLVKIEGATFSTTGSFQQNTNYEVSDGSGTIQVRIDNNTDLVNAIIPTEAVDIIAVVSRYGGDIQVLPRFVKDLNIKALEIPGSDIPDDQTFDIVTWNLEWFGSPSNGPVDDNLQIDNAAEVIQTINADVYALQEISNSTAFNTLLSKLTGYRGFISPITQTQKTAFIYKPSVVDSLTAAFLSTSWSTSQSWGSGRYPYEFICSVTLNGESRTLFINTIHAKALGDADSYQRRVNDSNELKAYFDQNRSTSNIILLGDYNDLTIGSTYSGSNVSPYQNFINDPANYLIVTKALEEKGFKSYSSSSMIDHIMISNELFDEYFEGTEQVENPSYIGNYLSTTTDHFPVKTRFIWGTSTSIEDASEIVPSSISLDQNYPNPFNPSTTISYTLNKQATVTLTIYSLLGETISTLVQQRSEQAGAHSVNFNASGLASGVYLYQLKTSDGMVLTKLMNLVK